MAVPIKRRDVSWMWVLLLVGLSLLAWISTYTGIMELIAASSGDIGFAASIAVAFAVFMLQLMILYILDAMFSGQLRWWLWPMYILGYVILFMISVGFAFGFYWKYLEAGNVTTASAESSIIQVEQDLQLGTSRLEQLQTTFTSLSGISTQKAETERNVGGTCPGSRAGEGPRRRLRESDAQRFQFANDFIAQRVTSVKEDFGNLNVDLQKIRQKDPSVTDPVTGSRGAFLGELNRKLGLVATRFNALRSDPQLLQLRDEFKTRAEQTSFPDDRGGTFVCPDTQLRSAVNGVVRAIEELPQLDPPEVRAYEGSEAVIEAFRRLTNSGVGWGQHAASAISGSPAPLVENGLTQRDWIPLIIAIFVDICILLVSVNRPFGPFFQLSRSMEQARSGGMSDYLETFYKVFQNQFDPDRRPSSAAVIAPIQDVVFDHRGHYYAAVPLDFREEDYREWLKQRTGPSAAEAIFQATSERPLEVSRYITSVFATLEGSDFVRLVDADMEKMDVELIKKKLDQQGSVYAQADAFRLYKFRRNAWAQILLQSVGSGASVEEKVAKRRTQTGTWERPQVQIPREQTEGRYIGEARAVPLDPNPAVEDEASKRLAIENHAGEGDIEPQDARFEDDGVDIDPDPNSYGNVKLPNGNGNGNRGGRTSGGGTPSARMATRDDDIGIVTWVRRLFGRG
jgi:hypothetical protein